MVMEFVSLYADGPVPWSMQRGARESHPHDEGPGTGKNMRKASSREQLRAEQVGEVTIKHTNGDHEAHPWHVQRTCGSGTHSGGTFRRLYQET